MPHQPVGIDLDGIVSNALRDLHCVLARDTTVLHLSPNVTHLTGHAPVALLGLPLLVLVHADDHALSVDELDQAAARPGHIFRFHTRIRSAYPAPSHAAFELCGHFSEGRIPGTGVFAIVARPSFLSCSTQMDAFLELKMEERALRRRIAALRAEAEAEADDDNDGCEEYECSTDDASGPSTGSSGSSPDGGGGGGSSNASSVVDGIVTALSQQRWLYVTGDLGIPFVPKPPSNAANALQRRRTKAKARAAGAAFVPICSSCNTTDSPEWRRGPAGPKTLCNACGLRYSKSRRKKATWAEFVVGKF